MSTHFQIVRFTSSFSNIYMSSKKGPFFGHISAEKIAYNKFLKKGKRKKNIRINKSF